MNPAKIAEEIILNLLKNVYQQNAIAQNVEKN